MWPLAVWALLQILTVVQPPLPALRRARGRQACHGLVRQQVFLVAVATGRAGRWVPEGGASLAIHLLADGQADLFVDDADRAGEGGEDGAVVREAQRRRRIVVLADVGTLAQNAVCPGGDAVLLPVGIHVSVGFGVGLRAADHSRGVILVGTDVEPGTTSQLLVQWMCHEAYMARTCMLDETGSVLPSNGEMSSRRPFVD